MHKAHKEDERYAATHNDQSDARRPARYSGADPIRVWGGPPAGEPISRSRGPARSPLYPGHADAYRDWECALSPGISGHATPRYARPSGPEGHTLGRSP